VCGRISKCGALWRKRRPRVRAGGCASRGTRPHVLEGRLHFLAGPGARLREGVLESQNAIDKGRVEEHPPGATRLFAGQPCYHTLRRHQLRRMLVIFVVPLGFQQGGDLRSRQSRGGQPNLSWALARDVGGPSGHAAGAQSLCQGLKTRTKEPTDHGHPKDFYRKLHRS
jgi:hypothetical protein